MARKRHGLIDDGNGLIGRSKAAKHFRKNAASMLLGPVERLRWFFYRRTMIESHWLETNGN
jgi:hypothetical protein